MKERTGVPTYLVERYWPGVTIERLLAALERGRQRRAACLGECVIHFGVAALAVLLALARRQHPLLAGCLLHQPEAFSLLSYLSKSHFIYIIEFHLLAWVFFSALYAPFAFWDLFRKRAAPQLEPARPRAGLR